MNQTATMTPEPQRLRALERANQVRLARAELKRRIADGDVSAADVILAPPKEAKAGQLGICCSVNGVGGPPGVGSFSCATR